MQEFLLEFFNFNTEMDKFFEFEADFVESLRCIPMQVRLKLDTCGVKLKLLQWHKFSATQRQELVSLPCQTVEEVEKYRQFLKDLVLQATGENAIDLAIDPNPAWKNTSVMPELVSQKAKELKVLLTLEQWENLLPVERFALIKLSRSSHENHNFLPALKEFGVVVDRCVRSQEKTIDPT